jgi:uncharacterized phage-associated protein
MMERKLINIDCEKITQALNFFALNASGTINKMKALKLLYFSDRYHIRKYGRLVSNDHYVAMKNGPVPSTAKDISELKKDFLCDETAIEYSARYIQPDTKKLHFASIRALDESVFSDSDIEALNFAWTKFGHLNQYQLRDLTHKYPEWKKQAKYLSATTRTVKMDLLDFFEDTDKSNEQCFVLEDQDRAIKKEHFSQVANLESLWR